MTVRVLGTAAAATAEDPFGPGDPLEVARLVRRALAAAGRRAVDVDGLALVADHAPDAADLARFTRRALGPVGAEVPAVGAEVPAIGGAAAGGGGGHEARCAVVTTMAEGLLRGGVAIAVALGPGAEATVRCVAAVRG